VSRQTSTRSPAAFALFVGAAVAGGLFALTVAVVPKMPTRLDVRAFDLLATTPGSVVARAVKLLAAVGPATAALGLVGTVAALVRRRRWTDAVVIVVGYPAVLVADHLAKAAVARPRPSGMLIVAGGFSFPSAEAALSVGLVVIAVALAGILGRRAAPAAIAAAILLIGLVGGLLVAVRVHYVTDVLAGWALGALVFAATAAVAVALSARLAGRWV
jgi:membrane-associated phospholipid phosphatase